MQEVTNMRLYLIPLLLAGCASAPPELEDIHAATLRRIPYKHYAGWDLTYVPTNKVEAGNCAKQAWTDWVDVKQTGRAPALMVCRVPYTQEGHVYVLVDGWALDGRYNYVIPANQEDCK